MNQQGPKAHVAGNAADLAPGEMKQIRAGARVLALFNIDGTFYATDDTCTHAFASLSEGYLDGDVVECPLHQGCFHIPTGKAMAAPATVDVRTYPVKVADGKIYIELPQDE